MSITHCVSLLVMRFSSSTPLCIPDQSTNDVLNTANKITLSLNDVSLFEGMSSIAGELLSPSGPRRPLLNFYHIQDKRIRLTDEVLRKEV